MPRQILDGRRVSKLVIEELNRVVQRATPAAKRRPGLGVIMVGHHQPSQVYVRHKREAAKRCNFHFQLHQLPHDASTSDVLDVVHRLNQDPNIDGILTQLPLPKQVTPSHIINAVLPHKDVDGIHPENATRFSFAPEDCMCPCTALGIRILLDQYDIPVDGAEAVVVGNSAIVGKPTARLLMHGGAYVTVCDKNTTDLKAITRKADLIISGVGKAGLITAEHLKSGATVVDVGIIPTSLGLVGDADASAHEAAHAVSPVPGGVGPMTIAGLLLNTFSAFAAHSHLGPECAAPAFCSLRRLGAFKRVLPSVLPSSIKPMK